MSDIYCFQFHPEAFQHSFEAFDSWVFDQLLVSDDALLQLADDYEYSVNKDFSLVIRLLQGELTWPTVNIELVLAQFPAFQPPRLKAARYDHSDNNILLIWNDFTQYATTIVLYVPELRDIPIEVAASAQNCQKIRECITNHCNLQFESIVPCMQDLGQDTPAGTLANVHNGVYKLQIPLKRAALLNQSFRNLTIDV